MDEEQGFTLIELMIVVAIIGILASIAIPQFSEFRVKSYNVAASSDIEKGIITMEAFYTDYYHYPNTHIIFEGVGRVTLTDGSNVMGLNLSKGVSLLYTKGSLSGYCLISKHLGGNKVYAANNASLSAIPLSTLVAESVLLQTTGAVVGTTDCSNMDPASVAAIAITG